MMGVCYFCGQQMVLRRSPVMPNPDAAEHLRSCWVYRAFSQTSEPRLTGGEGHQ